MSQRQKPSPPLSEAAAVAINKRTDATIRQQTPVKRVAQRGKYMAVSFHRQSGPEALRTLAVNVVHFRFPKDCYYHSKKMSLNESHKKNGMSKNLHR